MYIESVPNRGSPPAILLRESFRENGRVRKRSLANLSDWPTPLVEGFRTLLGGGGPRPGGRDRQRPRAAAGTRRRGARSDPRHWPRPAARQAAGQAPGTAGDRIDRQPPGLARLQARHRAPPGRRYRRFEPGPAVAARRRRRDRTLSRARLAPGGAG